MSLHSDILAACDAHNIELNTDAGQHFLIDEKILASIVADAELKGTEHVVEIGAGLGVLTRELVRAAGRVTAIEWDRRWIEPLRTFTDAENLPEGKLTIVNGNGLKEPMPQTPYCVVANIPYHITAPLLRKFFVEEPRPPDRAVLLIQREVADKLCTNPPDTYLGVMIALAGKTRLLRAVSPGAFLPPPAVDSAVIRIDPHVPPLADKETVNRILAFASVGFRGKRKMLRGTVGKFQDGLERLSAAGIATERRPETLSIAEWVALGRGAA